MNINTKFAKLRYHELNRAIKTSSKKVAVIKLNKGNQKYVTNKVNSKITATEQI